MAPSLPGSHRPSSGGPIVGETLYYAEVILWLLSFNWCQASFFSSPWSKAVLNCGLPLMEFEEQILESMFLLYATFNQPCVQILLPSPCIILFSGWRQSSLHPRYDQSTELNHLSGKSIFLSWFRFGFVLSCLCHFFSTRIYCYSARSNPFARRDTHITQGGKYLWIRNFSPIKVPKCIVSLL